LGLLWNIFGVQNFICVPIEPVLISLDAVWPVKLQRRGKMIFKHPEEATTAGEYAWTDG